MYQKEYRLNKVHRITKTLIITTYIFIKLIKITVHHKEIIIVKEIEKWLATYRPNKDQTPIMLTERRVGMKQKEFDYRQRNKTGT